MKFLFKSLKKFFDAEANSQECRKKGKVENAGQNTGLE